ncbi:MAG: right-handed parallel beta-helix repeat-containing protein [Prolixibacteraceae bacterium]|jgi:hypothetical protein|nr:right-handed parallel beta-helix repeat-containing protein [Prolixibacteraceae bacterium]
MKIIKDHVVLLCLLFGIAIFTSCKKEESKTIAVAVLSTVDATSITINSATTGGNISNNGGAEVTASGACWSTLHNPTVSGSHTSNGVGLGVYSSIITGLASGTRYYVRAYATNSVGTAYGNEVSFTTVIENDVKLGSNVHYVDVAGSDANDGSREHPWATLMYGVTKVTNGGDTIFFNAGTHTVSAVCKLPVGVSLLGTGNASVINITTTNDWAFGIRLTSDVVNTIGNQSISHLRFTGNSITAYGAIFIAGRGNVSVHDCQFEDFDDCAITFDGQVGGASGKPSAWCKSNKFYNNTITNCCKRQVGDWMTGALQIGAQEGMHINNNKFTENKRGAGNNGYCIKYYSNGYNKDLKIYDNTLTKSPAIATLNDWNFAIELWNWSGGIEIYNNFIYGSIDLDHVVKGEYAYGTRIHHNSFGYASFPPSSGNGTNFNAGIYIEFSCSDVFIYNNDFHNLESPIRFSPRTNDICERIQISYNVFNQIGNTNSDNGCNLMNFAGSKYTINNLEFLNNTVYAGTKRPGYGIYMPEGETFNHTKICNNIFVGFPLYPIEINGDKKNYLTIERNIFWGNGTNDAHVTGSPENYTKTVNYAKDPLFVIEGSNFYLKSTSPAIDAGIDVGLTKDYLGHAVPDKLKVDIGAYEYITTP